MLGLPDGTRACLFDLDGVLTDTAGLHAGAWAATLDAYLRERAEQTGEAFVAFDPVTDYARHVDGKRRADGVRDFLASRGIVLPSGDPDDSPEAGTVNGVANRKNVAVLELLREHGVDPLPGARDYVRAARAAGLATAVVSSSANARLVLDVTGLADGFDTVVDGVVARERDLPGKPAPDTFLAAAAELGVEPGAAAVFEDAIAGVEAARAGGFGRVVGIDRLDQADALRTAGADVVVKDLAALL
ncbi:HAD family hydrolase [Georgenia subflava]|uniref:Beta-phosphoglucomutase n=1 Tax=Georgenia subflava TaxID=1622177 RepID=A0A6N7EKP0_9MICO|nr:beta-phosphoglucomutase family hydrolase [Georgenia subflava]MPV35844.1 beta-phosphoglucomutase family hydrolase [Georgenia subflava]